MTRASTPSTTQTWANGQANFNFARAFGPLANVSQAGTGVFYSHDFQVDNNFIRVMAFNLTGDEVVTIEQITGQGAGQYISDYCPFNGPIQLSSSRTSYIIERPGRYRFRANNVTNPESLVVSAFRFAMENEATQDMADAIFGLCQCLNRTIVAGPGISVVYLPGNTIQVNNTGLITAQPTASVTPQLVANGTGYTLFENVNISHDPGNQVSIHGDGLYAAPTSVTTTPGAGGLNFIDTTTVDFTTTPDGAGTDVRAAVKVSAAAGNEVTVNADGIYVPSGSAPTPCSVGSVIPTKAPVNNYVAKDTNGCLQDAPLVSAQSGNQLSIRSDGLFAAGGGGGTGDRCSTGNLATQGQPTHFLGRDSNGCLVWFDISAGNGITFTYNTSTNSYSIVNTCYPCNGGGGGGALAASLCTTTRPTDLSSSCASAPGSVTYNETTVFSVLNVTGGTSPYTYDWSNATGITATWSSSLSGTPSTTVTPSTNTLTVSSNLHNGNAGSGSFTLTVPSGAYVVISDSSGHSVKRYFAPGMDTTCSTSGTASSGTTLNANVSCTSSCTPESLTVQNNGNLAAPSVSGPGEYSALQILSYTGNNASVHCGGSVQWLDTPVVTISDPLNTMGQGTTYTAPVTSKVNSPINPSIGGGGGTDTTWPNNVVADTDGKLSWAANPSTSGKGYGPEPVPTDGTFQTQVSIHFDIPAALWNDHQQHTVTIKTNASVHYELGHSSGDADCCGGGGTIDLTSQTATATFQG